MKAIHTGASCTCVHETPDASILSDSLPESTPTDLFLSDVSERDKPWDTHRANTSKLTSFYQGDEEFVRYAQRTADCSRLLWFLMACDDDGLVKLVLDTAKFCRVRHCPTCQWRRTLKWMAKGHEFIPRLMEDFPSAKYLLLTLTVPNCDITELRPTISHMNESFKRLVRLKRWPAKGYIRSLEVTRNKENGTAHPHFHCIVMVNSRYFKSKDYINRDEWLDMWQSCTRDSSITQVDVRRVGKRKTLQDSFKEVFKYCIKEGDMLADKDWFLEFHRQMHGVRAISTGGILRKYAKGLEKQISEEDDLIVKTEELDEDNTLGVTKFRWSDGNERYKYSDE